MRLQMLRFVSSSVADQDVLQEQYNYDDIKQIIQDQLILPETQQKQTESLIQKYIYATLAFWKSKQISTFRMIFELNLLAKRSMNDLSQYPIYPQLFGLSQQDIHARALSLPMILQDNERVATLVEKLRQSLDFGSNSSLSAIHFMHCAVPCWFMVRSEPFTTSHLLLQNCKFDQADRLFQSVVAAF